MAPIPGLHLPQPQLYTIIYSIVLFQLQNCNTRRKFWNQERTKTFFMLPTDRPTDPFQTFLPSLLPFSLVFDFSRFYCHIFQAGSLQTRLVADCRPGRGSETSVDCDDQKPGRPHYNAKPARPAIKLPHREILSRQLRLLHRLEGKLHFRGEL